MNTPPADADVDAIEVIEEIEMQNLPAPSRPATPANNTDTATQVEVVPQADRAFINRNWQLHHVPDEAYRTYLEENNLDPFHASQWYIKNKAKDVEDAANVRPTYAPEKRPAVAVSGTLLQTITNFVSPSPEPERPDFEAVMEGTATLQPDQYAVFTRLLNLSSSQNAFMNEERGRYDYDLDAIAEFKTRAAEILTLPEREQEPRWKELYPVLAKGLKLDWEVLDKQYFWVGMAYPIGNLPAALVSAVPIVVYQLLSNFGEHITLKLAYSMFIAQAYVGGFLSGDLNSIFQIGQSNRCDMGRGNVANYKSSLSNVPGDKELEVLFKQGIGRLFQAAKGVEDLEQDPNAKPVTETMLEAMFIYATGMMQNAYKDLQDFEAGIPNQGWGAPTTIEEASERYRQARIQLETIQKQFVQNADYRKFNSIGQELQNIPRHLFRNFGIYFSLLLSVYWNRRAALFGTLTSMVTLFGTQSAAAMYDERNKWIFAKVFSLVHAELRTEDAIAQNKLPHQCTGADYSPTKIKDEIFGATEARINLVDLIIDRKIRLLKEQICIYLEMTRFGMLYDPTRLTNYGIKKQEYDQYQIFRAKRIGKPADWVDQELLTLRAADHAAADFDWNRWKALEGNAHQPLETADARRLKDLEARFKRTSLTPMLWREHDDAMANPDTPPAERSAWQERASNSLRPWELKELEVLRIRKACTPADQDVDRLRTLIGTAGDAFLSNPELDSLDLKTEFFSYMVRLKYWGQDDTLVDDNDQPTRAPAEERAQVQQNIEEVLNSLKRSGLSPEELAECEMLAQKCFIGLTVEQQNQLHKTQEYMKGRIGTQDDRVDGCVYVNVDGLAAPVLLTREVDFTRDPVRGAPVAELETIIQRLEGDKLNLYMDWAKVSPDVMVDLERAISPNELDKFRTQVASHLAKLGLPWEVWTQIYQRRGEGWQLFGLAGTAQQLFLAAALRILTAHGVAVPSAAVTGVLTLALFMGGFATETLPFMNTWKDWRRLLWQRLVAQGEQIGQEYGGFPMAFEACLNAVKAPAQIGRIKAVRDVSFVVDQALSNRAETRKEYLDSRNSTKWGKRFAILAQAGVGFAASFMLTGSYRLLQHAARENLGPNDTVVPTESIRMLVGLGTLAVALHGRVGVPVLLKTVSYDLEKIDPERALPRLVETDRRPNETDAQFQQRQDDTDAARTQMINKGKALSINGFSANTLVASALAVGMTMIPILASRFSKIDHNLNHSGAADMGDYFATGIRGGIGGAIGVGGLAAMRLYSKVSNGLPVYEISGEGLASVGELAIHKVRNAGATAAAEAAAYTATALSVLTTLAVGTLIDYALGEKKSQAMAFLQMLMMTKVAMHVFEELRTRQNASGLTQSLQAAGSTIRNLASVVAVPTPESWGPDNPKGASALITGEPDTTTKSGKLGWVAKNLVDRVEGLEQAVLRKAPSIIPHAVMDGVDMVIGPLRGDNDESHRARSEEGEVVERNTAPSGGNVAPSDDRPRFTMSGAIAAAPANAGSTASPPRVEIPEGALAPLDVSFASFGTATVTHHDANTKFVDGVQARLNGSQIQFETAASGKGYEREMIVTAYDKVRDKWSTTTLRLLRSQCDEFDRLSEQARQGSKEAIEAKAKLMHKIKAEAVERWVEEHWYKFSELTGAPKPMRTESEAVAGTVDLPKMNADLAKIDGKIGDIVREGGNRRQLGSVTLGKDIRDDNGTLAGRVVFGLNDSADSPLVVVWSDPPGGVVNKRAANFVVLYRDELPEEAFTNLGNDNHITTTLKPSVIQDALIEKFIAAFVAENQGTNLEQVLNHDARGSKAEDASVLQTRTHTYSINGKTVAIPHFAVSGNQSREIIDCVFSANKKLSRLYRTTLRRDGEAQAMQAVKDTMEQLHTEIQKTIAQMHKGPSKVDGAIASNEPSRDVPEGLKRRTKGKVQ